MPHTPVTRGRRATPSSPTLPKITPRYCSTASYATDPAAPKAKAHSAFSTIKDHRRIRACRNASISGAGEKSGLANSRHLGWPFAPRNAPQGATRNAGVTRATWERHSPKRREKTKQCPPLLPLLTFLRRGIAARGLTATGNRSQWMRPYDVAWTSPPRGHCLARHANFQNCAIARATWANGVQRWRGRDWIPPYTGRWPDTPTTAIV